MPQFLKNIQEKASTIRPRDLIYPGITLLFIIIVVIIFSLSTQFISKNINTAFMASTEGSSDTLNMANYVLVAKKLGITVPTTAQSRSTAPQTPGINSLTINILNATTKTGIAGALATALESAGYAKATTGNQSKGASATTITIVESKASFGPAILEEVKKAYPDATATTTIESMPFDVTIVIGSK